MTEPQPHELWMGLHHCVDIPLVSDHTLQLVCPILCTEAHERKETMMNQQFSQRNSVSALDFSQKQEESSPSMPRPPVSFPKPANHLSWTAKQSGKASLPPRDAFFTPAPHKLLQVLIVDDDIEARLPVDFAFRKQGCLTWMARNASQALEHLQAHAIDVIILDWKLGSKTGGSMLAQCSETLEKKGLQDSKILRLAPKIITYSGCHLHQIQFSKSTDTYFDHVDHWNKPILYKEIQKRSQNIIDTIKNRKGNTP